MHLKRSRAEFARYILSINPAHCSLAILLLSTAALTLVAAAQQANTSQRDGLEFFEKRVRPLLAARCYECHSANAKSLMGGLGLDSRDGTLKGGSHGPALIPGNPDKSLVIRAVGYADTSLQMPPGGKLPVNEIAILNEWIRIGAPDPRIGKPTATVASKMHGLTLEQGRKYWAFQPLATVTPPTIPPAVRRAAQARNPIDNFIFSRLFKAGIKPNDVADRRTLIRRTSMDLTGIPPTPREVSEFIADRMPDAYPRLIDRLLASPHYGERWGRHWLDLARYAESHGYEQDYDRPNAYTYRDFVIRAFNSDLPYNTFVKWQIAGDEIAPEIPDAMMATGFLGAGTHATQITKNQVEKERYDELDDMLSTTGLTMLGLTMGCARCHDHKYDPIPSKDYYRLLSTFTTTVRSDYDVDIDPDGYRKAKAAHDLRVKGLQEELSKYESTELPSKFETWAKSAKQPVEASSWYQLRNIDCRSAAGATFTPQEDGSVRVGGANGVSDTYTLIAHVGMQGINAIRLEALADAPLVRGGPGRADNGNFALSDFKVSVANAAGGTSVGVGLTNPRATFEQAGLPVRAAIDNDPVSAWAIDPQFGKDQAAVFDTASPIGFSSGSILTFTLKFNTNTGHNIGRFRLGISTLGSKAPLVGNGQDEALVRARRVLDTEGFIKLSISHRTVLMNWYRLTDQGWTQRNNALQAQLAMEPKPHIQKAMICSEGVQAIRTHTQGGDYLDQTHFLKRGDPNQKNGVATQAFLQVLMRGNSRESNWIDRPPVDSKTSYRRRSLANWLTDTRLGAGPLLARVIVNRMWQHHFGHGIVATASDFGTQGDRPAHPELLEWLANELVRNGWRLKPIHKLMMTSATYLEASASDPARQHIDPENKLCWRHSRQRLEAEIIRDSMLAVSGLLDTTMFGPGTLDEKQRRRSIYFFIKRSQLIPSMTLFDAPNALQSIASRDTTTVAPQALLMLNSARTREVSRALARRATSNAEDSTVYSVSPASGVPTQVAAIRRAYLLTLGRLPDALELSEATRFVNSQSATYTSAEAESAFVDFCQVLLSLNEFVYID